MPLYQVLDLPRVMTERATEPPPFEAIQSDARYRLFRSFSRMRLVNTPIWAGLCLWLGLTQPPLWRQAVLVFLAAIAGLVVGRDYLLFRRERPDLRGGHPQPLFLVAPNFGVILVLFLTGGIESPMLPTLPVITFTSAYFTSERVGRLLTFGLQLPGVVLLALLATTEAVPGLVPPVFGGGARAGHSDILIWSTAALAAVGVVATYRLAVFLRASYEEMFERAAAERDRTLEMHAGLTRALTTLGGELAHELKNPLASVKGLAALMAMDAHGESAEQLGVLRREVDRMQEVLEDFLNFSRPLSPLAQKEVDLGELAREAATLHEGMAMEQGVTLGVSARDGVNASCDDRKVMQVLINLIQNAIDASPEGGQVGLEVFGSDGLVHVRVIDEGAGLNATVRDRLFEPGMTSKPNGSGLGLTVARTLARQHGGDLSLVDGPGGGCVAELVLPDEPPERAEGGPK